MIASMDLAGATEPVGNVRTIDLGIGCLLPPSVDESLPERHLARFVVEMAPPAGMWGLDLTPDYTPLEAGLDRLAHQDEGAFIGQDALVQQQVLGIPDDVHGARVGRATSGAYGHVLGRSLAIGTIVSELSQFGTPVSIEILGDRKRATMVPESPCDPENRELRA